MNTKGDILKNVGTNWISEMIFFCVIFRCSFCRSGLWKCSYSFFLSVVQVTVSVVRGCARVCLCFSLRTVGLLSSSQEKVHRSYLRTWRNRSAHQLQDLDPRSATIFLFCYFVSLSSTFFYVSFSLLTKLLYVRFTQTYTRIFFRVLH